MAVTSPATFRLSFTATGTPRSGRSPPPFRPRPAGGRPPLACLSARVGLGGLGAGALGEHDTEGVQLGVVPRYAIEVELDELAGGDGAGTDRFGLPGDAGERGVCRVHRRASLTAGAARSLLRAAASPQATSSRAASRPRR